MQNHLWCPNDPRSEGINDDDDVDDDDDIVERTNKAEIRPEEQSEKTESCLENSWNEIQLKGP